MRSAFAITLGCPTILVILTKRLLLKLDTGLVSRTHFTTFHVLAFRQALTTPLPYQAVAENDRDNRIGSYLLISLAKMMMILKLLLVTGHFKTKL